MQRKDEVERGLEIFVGTKEEVEAWYQKKFGHLILRNELHGSRSHFPEDGEIEMIFEENVTITSKGEIVMAVSFLRWIKGKNK